MGFIIRKNVRFKEYVPVRYRGHGLSGEGYLQDLSLSGSRIKGITPVVEGLVLEVEIMVPGEETPLRIDRAWVQWVKGLEFGVELKPEPELAPRINKLIAALVEKEHGTAPR